jgi:DNA-binding response OmpR family regulator
VRLFHRSREETYRLYRGGVAGLRVLYIVEDHERSAHVVTGYLRQHAIEVDLVHRNASAVDDVRRLRPDVVLVDIGPPGLAGLELCKAIRAFSAVPIISASSFARDAVAGLEAGADDFVAEPYSLRELLARIRSRARRVRGGSGPSRNTIRLGPLLLNPPSLIVKAEDSPIALTQTEFECLHALARNPGVALSRELLFATIYGSKVSVTARAVDVIVSRLRRKLGDDRRRPRWIRTVRHVGYLLSAGT